MQHTTSLTRRADTPPPGLAADEYLEVLFRDGEYCTDNELSLFHTATGIPIYVLKYTANSSSSSNSSRRLVDLELYWGWDNKAEDEKEPVWLIYKGYDTVQGKQEGHFDVLCPMPEAVVEKLRRGCSTQCPCHRCAVAQAAMQSAQAAVDSSLQRIVIQHRQAAQQLRQQKAQQQKQ
jgi:hypothetical protein